MNRRTPIFRAAREKRWQDVEMLLNAGITVLSTLNVQHLESLNDEIFDITNVRVREVAREVDEDVSAYRHEKLIEPH